MPPDDERADRSPPRAAGAPAPDELLARIPPRLLEPARAIATALAGAGHRAWVVGGAVRDLLLARGEGHAPIVDIDIASGALPGEVEALFEHTVAVGRSFGVVIVVVDGVEVEVATFREERGYSDRRRPDEVVYTDSPAVDARRRDFTINALFLDPLTGEVFDPEGGAADLADGVLRAVGDPVGRFREDGLRILRMARFLARFDLEPAERLLEAARSELDSLEGVSPERVHDELRKVAGGPHAARAIETLHDVGAAARVLPGWRDDAAGERVAALRALPADARFGWFLAALLGGDARELQDRVKLLRASRDVLADALDARRVADELLERAGTEPSDDAEERGAWADLGAQPCLAAAAAIAAAAREDGAVAEARTTAERLREEAPDPAITLAARDLIDLGIAPGPALGAALERVRLAGLGGAFSDRDGAALWARANVVDG